MRKEKTTHVKGFKMRNWVARILGYFKKDNRIDFTCLFRHGCENKGK